ncbi:hypothetical protein [Candidatus Regiella insecticola]|uniref:Uncharacterized protein n=1 Tax=Candidatus Regiella insecticola TaxID=138073 RepID=A0A6L2ZPC8_9ENTR|nr:hypothetical protein [Candidatus Regiella insecticola]GFN46737.1 hypothetical protein RINTU1_24680 [Candidatus Regiella insecticola]
MSILCFLPPYFESIYILLALRSEGVFSVVDAVGSCSLPALDINELGADSFIEGFVFIVSDFLIFGCVNVGLSACCTGLTKCCSLETFLGTDDIVSACSCWLFSDPVVVPCGAVIKVELFTIVIANGALFVVGRTG